MGPWGREQKTCNISKRCKIVPRLLYNGLIWWYEVAYIIVYVRAFDWHQYQWPWMTLNGWNVPLAEIGKSWSYGTFYVLLTPPLFHPNFELFSLHQIADVGVSERMGLKLFGREIIFEESQPMWSRYLVVTDGQTDGQTDDMQSHNRAWHRAVKTATTVKKV